MLYTVLELIFHNICFSISSDYLFKASFLSDPFIVNDGGKNS